MKQIQFIFSVETSGYFARSRLPSLSQVRNNMQTDIKLDAGNILSIMKFKNKPVGIFKKCFQEMLFRYANAVVMLC